MTTERFHARRVAEIEPEDFETMAPFGKVRLLGVATSAVPGKACGHDERRTGTQQLDPRLVSDLHATAGQQRHPSRQVGGFATLGKVEVSAGTTHLVVERMDFDKFSFAHIAMLRCVHAAIKPRPFTTARPGLAETARPIETAQRDSGWVVVRRGEDGLAAHHANSCSRHDVSVALDFRGPIAFGSRPVF